MNPYYIIDGYNLIHHIPTFRYSLEQSLEQARNTLISFARNYLSLHKVKMTIVFDGDEVGYTGNFIPSNPRLKIIYSKPPDKADPIIKKLIQQAKNKKSLILVSADNDLLRFSLEHGARVLSPEDFYHLASKHPNHQQMDLKYNSHLHQEEVDEWLKLFMEKDE